MEFGCKGVPFEVKFADSGAGGTGSFEGYGAVFGNQDSHGDVIERGAFSESLATRARQGRPLPAMYKMHGAVLFPGNKHEPIGVWESMSEDTKGLHVKGRLVGLDTDQGRWNLALVKEGALRGLSIGYSVPSYGARKGSDKTGEPKRYLKALQLREVSLVDDPSNAKAWVTEMKGRANAGLDQIDLSPGCIEGYATRYLKVHVAKSGDLEAFAPGCFARSLCGRHAIRLLLDHQEKSLIATSADSLQVVADDYGLAFRCNLPATAEGAAAWVKVQRKGRCGASIGYHLVGERSQAVDGIKVRIITDVILGEISLVEEGAVAEAFAITCDGTKGTLRPGDLGPLIAEGSALSETMRLEQIQERARRAVWDWPGSRR